MAHDKYRADNSALPPGMSAALSGTHCKPFWEMRKTPAISTVCAKNENPQAAETADKRKKTVHLPYKHQKQETHQETASAARKQLQPPERPHRTRGPTSSIHETRKQNTAVGPTKARTTPPPLTFCQELSFLPNPQKKKHPPPPGLPLLLLPLLPSLLEKSAHPDASKKCPVTQQSRARIARLRPERARDNEVPLELW